MVKVYVVTDNGGVDYEGEGSMIIGIYSTIEKAINRANKYVIENNCGEDDVILLNSDDYPNHRSINYDDGRSDYSFIDILEYELDVDVKI